MPNEGVSTDFLHVIEDLTAEILAGREALIELEAVILANRQYGGLSEEDAAMLFEATDKARQAVRNGLQLARLVRSPPPDLEGLSQVIDEWNEARRAERREVIRSKRR